MFSMCVLYVGNKHFNPGGCWYQCAVRMGDRGILHGYSNDDVDDIVGKCSELNIWKMKAFSSGS